MLKRFLVLFFLSSSLALNLPSLKVVDESPKPLVSSNQTTCPTCLQIKSNTAVQNYYPWLFNNARYSLENEALHIRIIEDTEDSDSWIEWKIFVLIFHHSIFSARIRGLLCNCILRGKNRGPRTLFKMRANAVPMLLFCINISIMGYYLFHRWFV